MSSPDLFFDSSALFAGVVSASGASRALLLLAEAGQAAITVSEQVIVETERVIAREIPRVLPDVREAMRSTGLRIVRDPSPDDVEADADTTVHRADVPILAAAMQTKTDYLVTFNRRHFMADPDVAVRSGLRISTPGDALAWAGECLGQRRIAGPSGTGRRHSLPDDLHQHPLAPAAVELARRIRRRRSAPRGRSPASPA